MVFMIAKLRAYFFSGLLVVTPISLTLYVVAWIAGGIDQTVVSLLPKSFWTFYTLPFEIPGLGIVILIALLILIGAITRGFLGNILVRTGERILDRVPIARSIYSGTKQIMEAVFSGDSVSFKEVGLIEYPRKGIWSLCFVTGATKGEVQDKTENDVVNVFVPTTPNPTSGFLLFVPRSDIVVMNMSIEEGIKMVVSAGIVTPKYVAQKEK